MPQSSNVLLAHEDGRRVIKVLSSHRLGCSHGDLAAACGPVIVDAGLFDDPFQFLNRPQCGSALVFDHGAGLSMVLFRTCINVVLWPRQIADLGSARSAVREGYHWVEQPEPGPPRPLPGGYAGVPGAELARF